MSPDEQLADSLAKPTPDPQPTPPTRPLTGELRADPEAGTVEVVVTNARTAPLLDEEGADVLTEHGLEPSEWTATSFGTSAWTLGNGEPGHSARWHFARKAEERPSPPGPDLDDLFAAIPLRPVPAASRADGSHGFLVALGDMQFGKIDGDGAAGTLARTLSCLDQARAALDMYRLRYDIGHVHLAWLGDHVEGFVSQGGANVWRTNLTTNEQIRLTRRVMLHALQLFAEAAPTVTMAAVPGNHGEPQRFSGKGQTRYDDSHDTESLIAVADATRIDPARFGHVRFYVPDTDELTVVLDVAGTTIGHAHGNQWRPGSQFGWWSGQAFGGSPLAAADLLLAGHFHSFYVDTDGRRMSIQVPALEHSSVWWRHKTGTGGDPGIVVAVTRDGLTPVLEVVRAETAQRLAAA